VLSPSAGDRARSSSPEEIPEVSGSTSPITYLTATGLVVWGFRNRAFGWLALAVSCLADYVNASVEDSWGGSTDDGRIQVRR
jgi:hypothetical protein